MRLWKRRRGRLFRLLCLALVALCLYMVGEAHIVLVERTNLYLRDLPAAFDGTTILFVSDLHCDGLHGPDKAAQLMEQLQTLYPDLLVLGGDYASTDALSGILARARGEDAAAQAIRRRDEFFLLIEPFYAPLGKYGVRGNHDKGDVAASFALGGVRLLDNEGVRIKKDGAALFLLGLDDWSTGRQTPEALAALARTSDCVVAASHSPDALPALNQYSSQGGGAWVDLMLSGHTHGGQVTLFGSKAPLVPSIYGDKFLTGWHEEGGAQLLVSNGVGTTALPFRLCAPPQAHLVTLKTR